VRRGRPRCSVRAPSGSVRHDVVEQRFNLGGRSLTQAVHWRYAGAQTPCRPRSRSGVGDAVRQVLLNERVGIGSEQACDEAMVRLVPRQVQEHRPRTTTCRRFIVSSFFWSVDLATLGRGSGCDGQPGRLPTDSSASDAIERSRRWRPLLKDGSSRHCLPPPVCAEPVP